MKVDTEERKYRKRKSHRRKRAVKGRKKPKKNQQRKIPKSPKKYDHLKDPYNPHKPKPYKRPKMPKVETVLTDEDLKIPLASPYGQISSGNRIQAFQIRKVAKLPSQSFDFNDSLASIVGEVPFDDLDSEVSQVFQRDAGSASVRWSENCDLYPQSRAKSATSPEVQLLRPMSADVREFLDQYRSQSSDQIAMVPVLFRGVQGMGTGVVAFYLGGKLRSFLMSLGSQVGPTSARNEYMFLGERTFKILTSVKLQVSVEKQ